MKIVRPFTVTEASILSTDVPETDAAVWSSVTTYSTGQTVIKDHHVWESLVNSNTNQNPTTTTGKWLDLGPTNRWRMFDANIGSSTSKTTSFTYTIQVSGRVDTVAFLNVRATAIRVKMTDAIEGVVYDVTFPMVANAGIQDWYAYYNEPIRRFTSKVVQGLPTYLNPVLEITVTNAGADASLGVFIAGQAKDIGRTQYGSSVGIIDYSTKLKDDFGNISVVARPNSKRGSYNIEVPNGLIDELYDLLSSYTTVPILYIGTDCYEATTTYGFFKDFTIAVQYVSTSTCSLEVEGLT